MYIAASINLVGQREKLTGQMPKLAGKCPVTVCYYEHCIRRHNVSDFDLNVVTTSILASIQDVWELYALSP